jgi:hypothetical protein
MARKWGSPAQKRALRKMLAVRAKLRSKARAKRRKKRRINPTALIANPGKKVSAAPRRRITTATKGKSMAKRRKRRAVKRRAAPHKRRRMRGARKSPVVIYKNPSRRRRRRPSTQRRRVVRRRRNPSIRAGGLIKNVFTTFAAGFVTSGLAAVFDTQLAKFPLGKRAAKLGVMFAIAHFGRRHPRASAAAIGALAASEGYAMGVRLSGGIVATTPQEAVDGLAEMSDTHPEMGALLQGGVGALLEGVPNVGESVSDYEMALSNTAGGMGYGDDYDDE